MQWYRPLTRVVVPRCTVSGFHLCSVSLGESSSSKGSSDKKAPSKKIEEPKTKPVQETKASKKKEPMVAATKEPIASTAEKVTKFDISSYKVPEYYTHNEWSFYDIEAAMNQFRIPQPSSVKGS